MYKVTFQSKGQFYTLLKKRVDQYFVESNKRKTGNWSLYSKAVILVTAAILIYLSLMIFKMPGYLSILLCVLEGAILSSIGFNVMHDACHGSYSSRKWVNNLLGYSLNALGGNAFFWKQKHNVLHHTYTNIEGADDDIAQTKLLRQSPTQKWMSIHHFQHIYLPFIYALTIFMWVGYNDFRRYFTGKMHNTPLPPMDRREHLVFWVSKVMYFLFYIIVPILCVGWLPWLIGYIVTGLVIGIILAFTFQLAHAVEGPEFDSVGINDKMMECEWAIHQVKTTANFAPRSKILGWYVGGLNFQVEHHLFPRISHIHYPAISEIVKKTCEQFKLPYYSFTSLGESIVSHVEIMKKLGRKPVIAQS